MFLRITLSFYGAGGLSIIFTKGYINFMSEGKVKLFA